MNRRDFGKAAVAATVAAAIPTVAMASEAPRGMTRKAQVLRAIKRYVRQARRRLRPTDDFVIVREVEGWPHFDTRAYRVAFHVRFVVDPSKGPGSVDGHPTRGQDGYAVSFGGGIGIPHDGMYAVVRGNASIEDFYKYIDTVIDRANELTLPSDRWKKAEGAYIRIADEPTEFFR